MNIPVKNQLLQISEPAISSIRSILLILSFLLIRLLFHSFLGVNETDVLPAAKQFMDHSWLPKDWYLNQDIGYRVLFNSFIGIPAHFMSFVSLAIAGRFVVILLWSVMLTVVIKEIKISAVFIIPLLWLFTEEQSIIAGEWMLQALETKTFAYLALTGSIYFLNRKRYRLTALFLGLSLSFHVLVGGYGTIGILLLMILDRRKLELNTKTFLLSVLIYAIAGSIGIFAVFQNLTAGSDVNKLLAGLIYVHARVPHHVLPSYWLQRGGLWKPGVKLVLSLAVIIPAAVKPWNRLAGILARFSLISLLFAAAGTLFIMTGREYLLKFYPFRIPDTMIPFTAYFLFFSYISRMVLVNRKKAWRLVALAAGMAVTVLFSAQAVYRFAGTVGTLIMDPGYYLTGMEVGNPQRDLYEWIRFNLPKETVFLIPPKEEGFYLAAEHVQFIDFKHSPQSEKNILEWYRRLSQYSKNALKADGSGFDLTRLNDDYFQISPSRISSIAKEYLVDYYIGHVRDDLPFPVVYSSGNWAIYKIRKRS